MQGRPTLDDLIANLSVGFPRAIFEGDVAGDFKLGVE